MSIAKIVIFGSGSFGTALASLVAANAREVVILTRRMDVANGINRSHRNPMHLSAFTLPTNVRATTEAKEAVRDAYAIVHAIPTQHSEGFLLTVREHIEVKTLMICCAKGLDERTLELAHETFARVLGIGHPCAFFGGPTFARELIQGTPSGGVMAARDMTTAERAAACFRGPTMRVYPSTDVVGVEIGGALKNVIAILCGGLEGMGLGVNAQTLLVTRGCREIMRFGVAMGAREHTMWGLSGVGDLMLTCLGNASRNKAVGIAFGKGQNIKDILDARAQTLEGVAEGVATAPAAERLAAKLGIEAPMIATCAACLRGELDASEALQRCMALPIKPDEPLINEKDRRASRATPSIAALCLATLIMNLVVTVVVSKKMRALGK